MINTNTGLQQFKSNKLKLATFNYASVVKNNLPIMIDYLTNHYKSDRSFDNTLALSSLDRNGQLIIINLNAETEYKQGLVDENGYYKPIYAKKIFLRKSFQREDTVEQWSERILYSYYQYICKIRNKQSKMNVNAINKLIKDDSKVMLFYKKSYIDWLIPQLENIDGSTLDTAYLHSEIDYLVMNIVANYSHYKQVNLSVIDALIESTKIPFYDILDTEIFAQNKTTNNRMFIQLLVDTLTDAADMPKVIDDRNTDIDFGYLTELCQDFGLTDSAKRLSTFSF